MVIQKGTHCKSERFVKIVADLQAPRTTHPGITNNWVYIKKNTSKQSKVCKTIYKIAFFSCFEEQNIFISINEKEVPNRNGNGLDT